MPHLLRFNYYGGTTLSLTAAPWNTLDYEPATPDISPVIEVNDMEDGEEIVRKTRRNVKETITCLLEPQAGQNMSQVQGQVELIERLLSEAFDYEEDGGHGYKTYLEFQPENTTGIYRSEILGGSVEVRGGNNARNWTIAKKLIVVINIYRRFYWEGDAASLTLTNSGGSGATLTVYNRDEATAGYDNYVTSNTTIAGVLPTPAILTLQNTYATNWSERFLLGLSAYADTTFKHLYDSSEGTPNGGSTDSDAIWNNGAAFLKAMPIGEGRLMYWDVTGAELAKYKGRYFRVFVRTGKTIQTTHYLRFKIAYPAGTFSSTIADTGEIHVDSSRELQDLGVVQIPPNLVGLSSLASVSLIVYGNSEAAGNFYLDYLLLMPADSFQVAQGIDYGLIQNRQLIVDGSLALMYAQDSGGGNKVAHFVPEGRALMLRPNHSHKLVIMVEDSTGAVALARTTTVNISYRPRRITI